MRNVEQANDRGVDHVPRVGDLVGLWYNTDINDPEPIIEGFVVDYRPIEGLIIVNNGVDDWPVSYPLSLFTTKSLPLEENSLSVFKPMDLVNILDYGKDFVVGRVMACEDGVVTVLTDNGKEIMFDPNGLSSKGNAKILPIEGSVECRMGIPPKFLTELLNNQL